MRTITCREAEGLMRLALDGESTDAGCGQLDEHLAQCEKCAALHRRNRGLQEALRTCPKPELTDGAWARITATAGERLSAPREVGPWRFVTVAVVLGVAAVGAILLSAGPSDRPSLLAATLEAMGQVQTVHARGERRWVEGTPEGLSFAPGQAEWWYEAGRGLREDTEDTTWWWLNDRSVRYDREDSAAIVAPPDDRHLRWFERSVSAPETVKLFGSLAEVGPTYGVAQFNGREVHHIELIIEGSSWRLWVDPSTKLVLRSEVGEVRPGPCPALWAEYEYDASVPEATLRFQPAEATKVTDLRGLPLAEARLALRTQPVHEITVARQRTHEGYSPKEIEVGEAWALDGRGSRSEHSLRSYFEVWRGDTIWRSFPHEDLTQGPTFGPKPRAGRRLASLLEAPDLRCDLIEVHEQLVEGMPTVSVSVVWPEWYRIDRIHDQLIPRSRPFKTVATLGVDTERLIELRKYMDTDDGGWQWVETTSVGYPASLPDDVFEFTRDWSRPTPPIWDEERKQHYIDLLAED